MPTASERGRSSRRKGAAGEREICKMLAENLGGQYNRLLKQYQQSQLSDIEQLVGVYSLEVKNCAKENLRAWWQQAVCAADKRGAVPCLAYKITRKGWRFVVPMPEAWNSGHQWARDLQYTKTLYPDGFFLLVREQMGQ